MPSRQYSNNIIAGKNDPNYLHYFYANAEEDIGLSGLHSLINKSAQEIIGEHLINLSARKIDLISNSNLTVDQQRAVREMIDGTFFNGMESQKISNKQEQLNTKYFDLESAINFANAQSSLQQIQSIDDYITAFQNFLDAFFTKENMGNIWRKYTNEVIQNYLAGRTLDGELANQIIMSVLNKTNGTFFKINNPNTGEPLPAFISRLAIFLEMLPYSPIYSEALQSDGSELKTQMINKFKGWTNYLIGIASEYAIPVTTLKGSQPLFQKLKDLNATMERVGGKNIKIDFVPDKRQESILNEIDGALSKITGTRASKSDFNFVISENQIYATLGVNVKETKVSQKNDINTQKVSVKLQSSTPFLTLLMREGGLSGQQIDAVVQLAGGHGDTADLDRQWNQLVQYATYSCLLDALAGISTEEQAYFFSLNGRLYTMSDILIHIQQTLNNGTSVNLIQKSGTNNGLQRSAYYRRNNWISPSVPSTRVAEKERSPKARKSILDALYATKITINLDLAQYILLTNSALL